MVTNQISGSMNEMATEAAEMNEAVERVNKITGINRDHINTLVAEVSRFKVE
jgi:methyl-accepting chemotaxis protein